MADELEHPDAHAALPPDDAESREARIQALSELIAALASGGHLDFVALPELAAIFTASVYSKAFLEALAKRHADGLTDLVRERFRKNGKQHEVLIGVEGGASATMIVTEDLPDEARLALLELDVTAVELRGRVLRWDDTAQAWRPTDDEGASST